MQQIKHKCYRNMHVLNYVLLLLVTEVYHIYEVYTMEKTIERWCKFVRKIQGAILKKICFFKKNSHASPVRLPSDSRARRPLASTIPSLSQSGKKNPKNSGFPTGKVEVFFFCIIVTMCGCKPRRFGVPRETGRL